MNGELKNIEPLQQIMKQYDDQLQKRNAVLPNLIYNKDGNIKKLVHNLKLCIQIDSKFKNLEFNEFTQEVTDNRKPIDDYYLDKVRVWGETRTLQSFNKTDTLTAINSVAKTKSYHPIKEMIESKPWDGNKRVDTLFIDYIGAEASDYSRMIARKWLVGAVKRIYQPGCKFEIVPILQGKQGLGKSTLAQKLGGEYFTDSLKGLGNNKDDYQILIGTWIIELGELSSMNSTETETMKNFISANFDKIRLPYERVTSKYQRTIAFIGTSNPKQYLKDFTGNRRFYPIESDQEPLKNVFELDTDTVQQIWAEALVLLNQGEQPYLDFNNSNDKEIIKYAEEKQSNAVALSGTILALEEYLNMPVEVDWESKRAPQKKSYFLNYHEGAPISPKAKYDIEKITISEILNVVFEATNSNYNNASLTRQARLYMDNHKDWQYKKSIRFYDGKITSGYVRR